MYKMTKILVSLILFSIPILGKDDWTKNKKAITASIKKHQKELISISDQIWSNAELALEEHKSSKILSDYAEKNGFNIERGVAGMPTAFIATYGSGRPRIGILGEFDANAGISQKAQSEKEALIEGQQALITAQNMHKTQREKAYITTVEKYYKNIHFYQEKKFLGTFGGIKFIEKKLTENFFFNKL